MAEQRIDQSVLTLTGARMNCQVSRFVDNNEIVIFKKNIEWNRLRSHLDLFEWRLNKMNLVTASDDLAWPGGLLVESNEPTADQLLKTRPGIFRKSLRQKLIEAQSRVVG